MFEENISLCFTYFTLTTLVYITVCGMKSCKIVYIAVLGWHTTGTLQVFMHRCRVETWHDVTWCCYDDTRGGVAWKFPRADLVITGPSRNSIITPRPENVALFADCMYYVMGTFVYNCIAVFVHVYFRPFANLTCSSVFQCFSPVVKCRAKIHIVPPFFFLHWNYPFTVIEIANMVILCYQNMTLT